MEKLIIVDFAGTLIKASAIEEANKFRAKILERGLPSQEEHAKPAELYSANRDFVSKLTGITYDMKIKYRENDLDLIELSGIHVQNQIATNLFQIGMYMVAKKYGKEIVPEGFLEELERIKGLGYNLAIVSGVRTDIISGMFAIAGIDLFDYIIGQPPILGVDNLKNSKELAGDIKFVIGDKESDFDVVGFGKKIFVKWGHASGGEEEIADFVIEKPSELKDIIN